MSIILSSPFGHIYIKNKNWKVYNSLDDQEWRWRVAASLWDKSQVLCVQVTNILPILLVNMLLSAYCDDRDKPLVRIIAATKTKKSDKVRKFDHNSDIFTWY